MRVREDCPMENEGINWGCMDSDWLFSAMTSLQVQYITKKETLNREQVALLSEYVADIRSVLKSRNYL